MMPWPARLCELVAKGGPHEHRVDVGHMGGFHAKSSDDALGIIESFVVDGADNLVKLDGSGAEVKHLFVRLNQETDAAVSRPFGGPPVATWAHFGLPSRPPFLPASVDEMWVVFTPTGEGWHWDGGQWEKVVPSPWSSGAMM